MTPREKIDYSKTNDLSRHRYQFWCMFPSGETIRNEFAVPGSITEKDADLLAMLAWAESLQLMVGRRLPQPLDQLTGKPKPGALSMRTFTRSMAEHATQNGFYKVARPGEKDYRG